MTEQAAAQKHVPQAGGERTFLQVLVNTAIANITTSFLWFALTFWVYLETRSVLATGIIGGARGERRPNADVERQPSPTDPVPASPPSRPPPGAGG